MISNHVHRERRVAQRFEFHTSVSLRLVGSGVEACGFTQDLSGRGALLNTDAPLSRGDAIELTLVMPSTITLGENMRVRCRGRVVRVCGAGSKGSIAVQLEGAYEFLPDPMKPLEEVRISSGLDPEEAGMSANVFRQRGPIPS